MGRKNNRNGNRSNKSKQSYAQYETDYDLPFYKTGTEGIRVNSFKYKNLSQKAAHETIKSNILTFIGGEAGTAKTFICVAEAVMQLKAGAVKKVIISRPTVEAGTSLGFLPGGEKEKMDPYLIPIYDILEYFLGVDQLNRLMEDKIIVVVPFQMMRGRTFNDAYILLDEAQNATRDQLRLALTRIGENSQCVVTFDPKQCDLRRKEES
jgi:phosphate starvation-inducible PhoH-like protein